ncbi:Transgelin [Echinococcus granulosus]|uniref:Myophilin n=1 Tax=Echinococcus granulosus TaxID=6210 RepID=A0A068WKR6_ECHGR|nr:Transgelin [Echinococcus granulosus]CDS18200.1 Myophilin [Echinococcus granulosus]
MDSGYRAAKAGFAREVQMRIMEKYDAEEAAKVLKWVRLLKPCANISQDLCNAAQKIPENIAIVKPEDFHNYLKDGLVLGYLIGCLKPDEASQRLGKNMWKISDKPIFETNRQRERIGAFINFCQEMGVGSASAFQTDQLYEMTNLPQVVICLSQLGVEAQAKPGYNGPEGYWMQRHTENKRNFTEEQLKAGESVIGLQMGYTGGANQSGVIFGAQRKDGLLTATYHLFCNRHILLPTPKPINCLLCTFSAF